MCHGFVATVAKNLIGEMVEIYQGNSHDTMLYAEINKERKTVIRGRLLAAEGETFVLECESVIRGKGKVFVNAWTVQSIVKLDEISIFDIYNPDEKKIDVGRKKKRKK